MTFFPVSTLLDWFFSFCHLLFKFKCYSIISLWSAARAPLQYSYLLYSYSYQRPAVPTCLHYIAKLLDCYCLVSFHVISLPVKHNEEIQTKIWSMSHVEAYHCSGNRWEWKFLGEIFILWSFLLGQHNADKVTFLVPVAVAFRNVVRFLTIF